MQIYSSLVTETGARFAGNKSELISGALSSAVKFCRMISSVFCFFCNSCFSRTVPYQNEYERKYADFTERYNDIKVEYDKISEQLENKKAQRKLFEGFIRALKKQGALVEEFDEGLRNSLVQEVIVRAKDDIRFVFKNRFEIKTRQIKS